jgi:DNA-directed RNA polymerase specialized sigma24 family protein
LTANIAPVSLPGVVPPARAFVLFGDVVASRVDAAASSAWLRVLVSDLEEAYPPPVREARPGVTQGDEIQLLLRSSADPFTAVLRSALHPQRRPMRWAIAHGPVDPGRGLATERTGAAFLAARDLLAEAAKDRDRLRVITGQADADSLLGDLAPLLADLLDDLTDRQAEVARLMLIDELRGSDAAERLGVRRATVSVIAARARIRGIERLTDALRRIVAMGVEGRS